MTRICLQGTHHPGKGRHWYEAIWSYWWNFVCPGKEGMYW